ncbi:MAG: Ig-like domain-containing protein, partial [Cyclobacteriaceae bacterium]
IDATTQTGANLLANDGLVRLDGSLVPTEIALNIQGDNTEVYGLEVSNFNNATSAISIAASDVRIGDATRANVINSFGNDFGSRSGIFTNGGLTNVIIENNRIGTNVLGTAVVGSLGTGIYNNADNTQILGNLISGMQNGNGRGIDNYGDALIIQGNNFGTDLAGTGSIHNSQNILNQTAATGSLIGGSGVGEGNIIANATGFGYGTNDPPSQVTISRNSIFNNNGDGISLFGGSAPIPTITSASPTLVSGTCVAGDVIEVFDNPPGESQGRTYLGDATVIGTNWTFSTSSTVGNNITATATALDGSTSTFSAPAVIDGTPPTLSGTAPLDDDADIATADDIVLTFDEDIQFGTGSILIIDLDDGSSTVTIDAAAPGAEGNIATTVLTLDPATDLEEQTNYAVQIAGTAITDIAGNAYAGIGDNTTFNFTTADETAPALSVTVPLDDDSGVATSTVITLTFDEDIQFGTGNIEIIDVTDGSNSFTIDAASPGAEANVATNTLTLDPSLDLDEESNYAIQIAGTAITDLSGNAFAGIADNTTFDFFTADETDPAVTIDQASGQGDPVASGSVVFDVLFNEPITGFTDDSNVDYSASTVGGSLTGIVAEVSPFDGTTFTLTVSGMTGTGNVQASLFAGAAQDLSSNLSTASTSTDNTVLFDEIPPTLAIGTPSLTDVNSSATVDFGVTYTGASSISLTDVDVTINHSGTSGGTVTVLNGTTTTPTVQINGVLGDGSYTISIGAGTSSDIALNLDAGAGPSSSVNVDNTVPTLVIGTPSLTDVNSSATVDFGVTYTGATSINLTNGDVTINHSGTSGGTVVVLNGTTTTPTVQINGVLGDGSYTISIGTGTSQDVALNSDLGAGPSALVNLDNTVPTLISVSIASDNLGDPTLAIIDDEVTLTFTSSENIQNVVATIDGNAATVTGSATTWSASYIMQSGGTEGVLSFTIDFDDLVGNTGTQVTTVTDLSSVSFDETLPTLLDPVAIASNNGDASLAKVDDIVTLTFTSSEDVQNVSATIDGKVATITGGPTVWSASYTMQLGDTEGVLGFTIDFEDLGGNPGAQVSSVTDGSSVTFDETLPIVTVDPLGTGNATPVLTGTITDNLDPSTVTIVVTVNGQDYIGVNNGNGTWTSTVTNILPNATYDVLVTATDAVGNVGIDASDNELTVNALAPVVSVDVLSTNDPTPIITGQINDDLATIEIILNGEAYGADNFGNGTWQSRIFRELPDGVYDIQVVATSQFNIQGIDETEDELTIDTEPPAVTLDDLATNSLRPDIKGTIDDPLASIVVTINGVDFEATNNGDDTWILLGSSLTFDLEDGPLDIQVTATDAAGNPTLSTEDGVIILDATAPIITVDPILTGDNTPTITGTIDDPEAVLSVTIDGTVYQPEYSSETTWILSGDVFASPLEDGVYDVQASAIDSLENVGIEEATNELTIDAIPTTLAPSDLTTLSFTANWEGSPVTDRFELQVAEDVAFNNIVSGFDAIDLTGTSLPISNESFYHNTTYYYRVRLNYSDGTSSEFSEPRTAKTLLSEGLVADSTSLVSLYNELAGPDWVNSTNWLDGLVKDWFGVTVTGDRITALTLPNNGLKGDISIESFNNLDMVESINLSDNEISSIPILSVMDGLVSLDVRNNKLDFSSLELQGDNINLVIYAPQRLLLEQEQLIFDEGEDGEIDRQIGGINNVYQWLENGQLVEGGTDGIIGFNDIQFLNEGLYAVRVTNSLVPGLTITTEPVQVFVSSLERDSTTLVELYQALGGDNWADPSGTPIIGWDDTTPIAQWSFVTLNSGASRVEQVRLAGVGLVGDLPTVVTTMTSVNTLDLSNNELTYVPDLTGMRSLVDLNIGNNNLQYESLQQNIGIETYLFAPQRVLLSEARTLVPQGTDYDFRVPVRGEGLSFEWFYNGERVDSTNSDFYTIDSIGIDNMGDYNLIVTDRLISAIDPTFTLVTETQEILATANISGKVADIDGAPVNDGEVSIWRIREIGTAYDSIGTYSYVGDEYLIPNVVLGDYIHWVITDLNKHLPTYFQTSITWSVADPVPLRKDTTGLDIRVVNIPPELFPGPDNDNTIAGFLELDTDNFPPGTFSEGGRTQARRRVRRAGVGCFRAKS